MLELQVNVAQLLKESTGAARKLDVDEPLHDGGSPEGQVKGELKLTRTDRGVWVSGPLMVLVSGECSRCLKPIDYWVEIKVDDEFLPPVDVNTGAHLRYHDEVEADTEAIDTQHVLDLSDTVLQYRLAALPIAPVCKADCQGICSECGTDLNERTCDCLPYVDPRWNKLRELLR